MDEPKTGKIDAMLADLGLSDVPRFYVTREPLTPATAGRDDVVAGVRSLSHALRKINETLIPAAYLNKNKPQK